jgi:molybdate transport system regulatory protein
MKQLTPQLNNEICQIMGWSASSPAIELLKVLDQTGSINSAAKAVGLSYKSAWQKLDQINNLLPYPLVNKQTGGSGGGGTVLTDEGRELIGKIDYLKKEFSQFMEFFAANPSDALNTLKTLRRIEMKLSARNVWLGQVVSIDTGVVNSVVNIQLKGGDKISSVITDNSVRRLELAPGKEVMVIVKASCVMLGSDIDSAKISARNILSGTVASIVGGAVNDEVTIDLPGGSSVTSIITSNSVKRLGLSAGTPLSAVIKASDVLLAVA